MIRETLILFTRYPRAGRAKTRLIPRLGAEGAAQLQREMTEHALARVWPLARRRNVQIEVRFEDGSKADLQRWLGSGFRFVPQGDGDLGERMSRASGEAFAARAQAVVMVGADCPDLDAPLVERAFDALRPHRLVFGPARDGGYYLVGLNAAMPQLFDGIPWSNSTVLATSIERARQFGVEPFLLPELSDIDEPQDLGRWDDVRRANHSISVIIPTLNEAETLPDALKHASATGVPVELIVTDGGSHDDTLRIAQAHGAKVVTGPANRACQLNVGAKSASGETLLFLHADTLLPEKWDEAVRAALRRPDTIAGAFRFRIRERFPSRGLVEWTTNLRSRLWRMPYGDQALFVRRWVFDAAGGFADLPIMEDYEFVRRLRRFGRLALLDLAVLTSGRRWQRLGFLRTTLINKLVVLGYHCGAPPAKLAALYRGRNSPPSAAVVRSESNPRAT